MIGDLITFRGATDGTNTSGDFSLTSDVVVGNITEIKIPKGFKAKVWSVELSGDPCSVSISYSKDGGTTWITAKTIDLVSPGELEIEKNSRPIVVISPSGETLLKFSWSQTTAGTTELGATIEFEKM